MEKDITENFARNFCDLMVDQGRTYDELAEKAGISKATLSKYARDKQKPSAENAARIAQYLGVSTDALLGVPIGKTSTWSPASPPAPNKISYDFQMNTDSNGFFVLFRSGLGFKLIETIQHYAAAVTADTLASVGFLEDEACVDWSKYGKLEVDAIDEVLYNDGDLVLDYLNLKKRISDPKTKEDIALSEVLPKDMSKHLENTVMDVLRLALEGIQNLHTLKEKTTGTPAK